MRSRRNARIRLYALRTASLFLLGGITFFFLRGAIHMYERYSEARLGRAGAEAGLRELIETEARLMSQTERLSSDRGMEEELRRRYGVVRQGEGVIEIVSATHAPPTALPRSGVINWFKSLF